MRPKTVIVLAAALALCAPQAVAAETGSANRKPAFAPGAPGIGDPYFPLDGNGGYDVKNYDLDVTYDPATDELTGVATIAATATQDLSAFNLDFSGLTVRSVVVEGKPATWTRTGDEMTVTPKRGIRDNRPFTTVVTYDGVPEGVEGAGFVHTDDGVVVIGEPHVADTWYPVNDHPTDKASYTFRVTVPEGLEAVANGILKRQTSEGGWSTWTWVAREPMASYLTTITVGEYDIRAYEADGIQYWDALDPDLFVPLAEPVTGEQFAISQVGDLTYKRLARTFDVPAAGGQLSFQVNRETEPDWDYLFVEVHPVGSDDWTTLPDQNGHTSQETGQVCPFWLSLHPFLEHYQTDDGAGGCTPSGTTGDWWAASGQSDGWETWAVDLSAYAGQQVELSITYASDDLVQFTGVFIDDVVGLAGRGTTSFEEDGDALDGWSVPGAPEGSEPNVNDWIVGTPADGPPPPGPVAEGSLARQPEIIDFLEDVIGVTYPWSASGGIVDDSDDITFALENQTRPIYSELFFGDSISGDSVVVHELAHQWFGDLVALQEWQHIWLNEGFATYMEWLWSEAEGLGTAQEIFDGFAGIPEDSSFWSVVIGDPTPDALFAFPVYARGAMTLHALRNLVGDEDFFKILRRWVREQAPGNATTDDFIALAEKISGQQLDAFFDEWLFTDTKPTSLVATAAARSSASSGVGNELPSSVTTRIKEYRGVS